MPPRVQPSLETEQEKEPARYPGFVDLQVNGYAGIDFSSPELTRARFVEACAEIIREGACAAILPTIITSDLAVYNHVLPLMAAAMDSPDCPPEVVGIHLEGPFISGSPGAVGCHPGEHVRAPSIELLEHWQVLARGRIKLITVASELAGAAKFCRHATENMGIAVSLGHQMANGEALHAMADAGATLVTHLGNGMPNMIHRHNNPIWAALADDRLSAMLITDGEHLPVDSIVTMVRAKGTRKVIITSDVAPVAGLPDGTYHWGSTPVEVTRPAERGPTAIRAAGRNCLAGSGSLMLHCMNHLASLSATRDLETGQARKLQLEELLDVGLRNPLAAIGWSAQRIREFEKAGEPRVQFLEDQRRFVPL